MSDQQPPAGWYPAENGRTRWWDGNQWTEHYHDVTSEQPTVVQPEPIAEPRTTEVQATETQPAAAEPAIVHAAASDTPAAQEPGQPTTEKKGTPGWVLPLVAVVALVLGIGIGASTGGDSKDDAKPKVAAVKSTSGETTADLDAREKTLDGAASELKKAQADLDARAAKLTSAEKKAKANTIEGDGNYAVGDDIKAGTWKNPDAGDGCYWSINSDANGNNIVANNNGGGPQTVTVQNGQYLELQNGCGTWKRVG